VRVEATLRTEDLVVHSTIPMIVLHVLNPHPLAAERGIAFRAEMMVLCEVLLLSRVAFKVEVALMTGPVEGGIVFMPL